MISQQHPLQVIIVDDDRHAMNSLVFDLETPEIEVVARCYSEEEYYELLNMQRSLDVAVIDLMLHQQKDIGLRLLGWTHEHFPTIKCLMVSANDPDGEYFAPAIFRHARGFVRKSYAAETLASMVLRMVNGEFVCEPELVDMLIDRLQNNISAFDPDHPRNQQHIKDYLTFRTSPWLNCRFVRRGDQAIGAPDNACL